MSNATTTVENVTTAPMFDTKPAAKDYSEKRTKCPVSRAQFLEHAKDMELVINGVPMSASVKEFSTGSLGWYLCGKMTVLVDGKTVTVQIGGNFTVVGSKELPQ